MSGRTGVRVELRRRTDVHDRRTAIPGRPDRSVQRRIRIAREPTSLPHGEATVRGTMPGFPASGERTDDRLRDAALADVGRLPDDA